MRIFTEKSIPRLVLFTPLILIAIMSAVSTYYYLVFLSDYNAKGSRFFVNEYISAEKIQSEQWVEKMVTLFNYHHGRLEENIRADLRERVEIAYETASYIYEKYNGISHEMTIRRQIEDAMRRMVWQGDRNYIRITDYNGDLVLAADRENGVVKEEDAQKRSITLEEIQMARKNSEGFLQSMRQDGDRKIIFVKDFGQFEWFFGSEISFREAKEHLQNRMLDLVSSIPTNVSGFVALIGQEGVIYISDGAQNYINDESLKTLGTKLKSQPQWHRLAQANVYSVYYEPFGWHILYGFDLNRLNEGIERQRELFEAELNREMRLIVSSSILIGLIVAVLSLFISRRINQIFLRYKHEVHKRQSELADLNAFLEERVSEEVAKHNEKQKMLIQQSKMAAMGDMISMIAHQWRQPLNQLSYTMMNIEGAYQYDELTPEYLEGKMKEINDLLEYMSTTIDDFRNFFKPDRAKEETTATDVVEQTLYLIQNDLSSKGIKVDVDYCSTKTLLLYRNELMQVMLNLVKNAKDALVASGVEDPTIMLQTVDLKESIRIRICDNGGGIDESIREKIFEPYFTTKGHAQGTGLGLYMSKTIIEEHMQGWLLLECYSELTCFVIELPLDQAV